MMGTWQRRLTWTQQVRPTRMDTEGMELHMTPEQGNLLVVLFQLAITAIKNFGTAEQRADFSAALKGIFSKKKEATTQSTATINSTTQQQLRALPAPLTSDPEVARWLSAGSFTVADEATFKTNASAANIVGKRYKGWYKSTILNLADPKFVVWFPKLDDPKFGNQYNNAAGTFSYITTEKNGSVPWPQSGKFVIIFAKNHKKWHGNRFIGVFKPITVRGGRAHYERVSDTLNFDGEGKLWF